MEQLALNFDLTNEERAVLALLRQGRARARSRRELSEETGMGDVHVRQTIRRLIMERGMLIGSAVSDPPGYYIPETADEVFNATKSLRHRGIMILMRAARLQKSSVDMVFNQARLELEGV